MRNRVRKIKVLFLCTTNSARSQMAEAYLRKYAGDRYAAYSAGLEPREVHPLAVKVMAEDGIDIRVQESKAFEKYMGKVHFGYLIVVCSEAEKRCPKTFPGMGERIFWNLEDPAVFEGPEEAKLGKFREIRNQVKARVLDWLSSHQAGEQEPGK